MINYFALTISEMGLGKLELSVIGADILIILLIGFYLMVMDHEIIIFTPIFALLFISIVFIILKKRKRSAKSIYKLIDDLEKKYIY